eukprot:TRINITY_DN2608_c0_g1_i2.p2 TRINITY_DN2608_c0_g1~~TRINITY_DN2608_c0_g1_i2.p2  ORF type:complete len:156 (+),score=31.54 TRINITY_DN2608_c0_g1_i2:206-673(+)
MMKVNMSTINAVNRLSRGSGISVKSFMYAGTKDRFATTTQKVCVRTSDVKRTRAQLKSVAEVTLGNFAQRGEELKVGDLRGNRFCVALREFSAEDGIETVKESNDLAECRREEDRGERVHQLLRHEAARKQIRPHAQNRQIYSEEQLECGNKDDT